MAKLNSYAGDMARVTLKTVQSSNSLYLYFSLAQELLLLQCYLERRDTGHYKAKVNYSAVRILGNFTIKGKIILNFTCEKVNKY